MTAPSKSTVRYASGSVAHGAQRAGQTLSAVRIIAPPPRFRRARRSRVLRFSGRAGAKALRFVASGRAGAKARIRVQISRRVVNGEPCCCSSSSDKSAAVIYTAASRRLRWR